jgi:hypothetical protein
MSLMNFFNLPNPYGRALWGLPSLKKITIRIKKMFLGSKVRPVPRADKLTAICEPTVYTMWDPEHLTTL